jgi:S1-C subfamily serine protease
LPGLDLPKARQRNHLPIERGPDGMTPEEAINVEVYERCNKSVVHITSRGVEAENFFFAEIREGDGSGAVLDMSGHILTNYHVIEGARKVTVGLFDGSSYDAELVGADPIGDVAILKIDAPRELLFPVVLGDSSQLKVGMKVYAIGNPFGLERTMATGIVSSLNRSLQLKGNRSVRSIIQIDASVNPGNSGGPLLDSQGRLIGLTTAIASKTGQSAGVGFAIPVNLVTHVLNDLLKYGRVIRPESGIKKVYETDEGLLVASLAEGGPAEQAGLRGPKVTRERRGPFLIERIDRLAADRIIGVDGEKVETADDLLTYLDSKRPGEQVTLRVLRDGQKIDIPLVLGGDPMPTRR